MPLFAVEALVKAPFVTKQDRFKHAVRNGGTIHRNERCFCTLGMIMDKAGQNFLAGAGRPIDKDGDIGLGDTASQRQKVTVDLSLQATARSSDRSVPAASRNGRQRRMLGQLEAPDG